MPHLQKHWAGIKEDLLQDRYRPQPVRRVKIPKPDGGVRLLGVPTAVDRLIQQALLQVLTPSLILSLLTRVMDSVPGAAHTTQSGQPGPIWTRDTSGWWTWTWRSFSTGSTTTF